jgi:hypothetical protein
MPWDIAVDGETGDWIFDPARDILAVSGIALARQKIITRLKIPRGSFVYDEDGTLGSRLAELARGNVQVALAETPRMVREALADMPDISIKNVYAYISEDDSSKVVARVEYAPALEEFPDNPDEDSDLDIIDLVVGA